VYYYPSVSSRAAKIFNAEIAENAEEERR